jgi:hypothetical protein
MARYYFDITDGERHDRDDDGLEFTASSLARRAAVDAITEMACDSMPDESNRRLCIEVRDDHKNYLFRCSLTFTVEDIAPAGRQYEG